MITAEQAREKAISSRKNIEEVLSSIEHCANAGMRYSCFSIDEINMTEEMTDQLSELGFTMIISNNHLKIEW